MKFHQKLVKIQVFRKSPVSQCSGTHSEHTSRSGIKKSNYKHPRTPIWCKTGGFHTKFLHREQILLLLLTPMHINTEAGVVHYTKMRPFEAISPYVPSLLHRFFVCCLSCCCLAWPLPRRFGRGSRWCFRGPMIWVGLIKNNLHIHTWPNFDTHVKHRKHSNT